MNRIYAFRVVGVVVLTAFLVACSLPVSSTPTIAFPTADQAQTLTAVFHVPPSATPIPHATEAQTTSSLATSTTRATTGTATITPTAPNCTNLAQFVSETIPDYTYITPGAAFTKTWTLKNIGTCTWGTGYSLAYDHGDQMGGPATVPITTTVAPQATITVSVSLTGPTTASTYQGYWMLQSPQNVKFGLGAGGVNSFWVLITTNASSATAAYVPAYTLAPACVSHSTRPSANGTMVEAYVTNTAPSINADLTEWDNPLIYSFSNHVFTKSGLGDGSDHATFTFKWDSQYLYLAIHVVDNMFVQDTGGGSDLYKGDSIEILLDTNLQGDYCNHYLGPNDYQLGLSPGDQNHMYSASSPNMYRWYPSGEAGAIATTGSAGSNYSQIASTTVTGGWIIEARISWGAFDLPSQTIVGTKFGFVISASDNDTENTQVQERMISYDPNRVLTDPTTWGTLELEGKTGP